MAAEVSDDKVENLFNKLDSKRAILHTCTHLYQTLISHFQALDQSLTSESLTLDSKLQTLASTFPESINSLEIRESSISDRHAALSAAVETKKQAALVDFEKVPPPEDAPLADALVSACRRMDPVGLLKLVVARRKEANTLRAEMGAALEESVDPPRLVLDTVKEFVEQKRTAKSGLTDKRRACTTVVVGMFPPEVLKARSGVVGPEFSKAMVERAENVVREWVQVSEKVAAREGGGDGEELGGMGPAEASMFLQLLLGFGLVEKFDMEFIRKMVVAFANRRDMPMLAIPIFGDKIADIIDELVKKGKQVEAIYFAKEAGLTERFQPAFLLDSSVPIMKSNVANILKKGNHTHAAIDEANTYEINFIRYIIKCVEEFDLESEFSLESLKKRLAILEKVRSEKRKVSTVGLRFYNKRKHGSGAPARGSGSPAPHAAKMTKISASPSSYGQRNPLAPLPSSVSRYPAPYSNYPTYDAGHASSTYAPSYGGSHVTPSPAQVMHTPQHYGVPGDGVSGVGNQLGGSYAGQAGYVSYDYGAATPTFKPSPYAP